MNSRHAPLASAHSATAAISRIGNDSASVRRTVSSIFSLGPVLGLLAGCSSNSFTSLPTDGPLLVAPSTYGKVIGVHAGDVFTNGTDVIALGRVRPARLVSVTSVGGGRVLRFLGARLASPRRELTTTDYLPRWPPSQAWHAQAITQAVGVPISPIKETWHQQGYEVLLGYHVLKQGYGVRTEIRVIYEIDGTRYAATLPSRLVTCPSSQDRQTSQCLKEGMDLPG